MYVCMYVCVYTHICIYAYVHTSTYGVDYKWKIARVVDHNMDTLLLARVVDKSSGGTPAALRQAQRFSADSTGEFSHRRFRSSTELSGCCSRSSSEARMYVCVYIYIYIYIYTYIHTYYT